jgi:hypothetical protein
LDFIVPTAVQRRGVYYGVPKFYAWTSPMIPFFTATSAKSETTSKSPTLQLKAIYLGLSESNAKVNQLANLQDCRDFAYPHDARKQEQ